MMTARNQQYINYFSKADKATDWYFHKPLGLNGIPYLALRVIIELYPDIWQKPSKGDLARGAPPSLYNRLGFPPWPSDYEGNDKDGPIAIADWSGNLKPASQRNPLPYGLTTHVDFTNDANSIPGSENVFFSCAACHTGRVADKGGKVRYFPGGSATQSEAQLFAGLVFQTAQKFSNVKDFADSKEGVTLANVKPTTPDHFGEIAKLLKGIAAFDCKKYKPHAPNQAVAFAECRKQKMILLGKTETAPSDEKIASLSTTKFDDDVTEYKKPSVHEDMRDKLEFVKNMSHGVLSKDSNFQKLFKNLIGAGVKVAIQFYKVGVPSPYNPMKLAKATPDFGYGIDPNTIDFSKINQSRRIQPPPLFDERPGQMDAFGLVQGIIYLNASRPDNLMFKYFPSQVKPRMLSSGFTESYFNGYEQTAEYQESIRWVGKFGEKIGKDGVSNEISLARGTMTDGKPNFNGMVHEKARTWMSQAAALSDVKSLFNSGDEVHANWDGNEGAGARVLASGLSSVGDPTKVFTEIIETQNEFISNMPSPVYPFTELKTEDFHQSALRGQELFNKGCVNCHHKSNATIYDTGTDPNRAHVLYSPFARMALVALTQAACDWGKQREALRGDGKRIDGRSGEEAKKEYWCDTLPGNKKFANYEAQTQDSLRTYRGNGSGYKADALYGIWQDAPYFHNGSVPTLRLLLDTKAKRKEMAEDFVRGNIYYNEADGGFEYVANLTAHSENTIGTERNVMQKDDVVHNATFNTRLRGNDNGGHEFFHNEVKFDEATRKWIGVGTPWTTEQKTDVINYMKTL